MIPNSPSRGGRGSRSRGNAGGALCFTLLGLLHLVLINAADFTGKRRETEAPRFVVFDLLPPAPVAEAPDPVPGSAPAEPPAPVMPAPDPEPIPAQALPPESSERVPSDLVPTESLPPPAPAEGLSAGRTGEAAFREIPGAAPAGRRRGMSDAEYTALVMRRLEEKKIYPLAMRKRGIAGDAETLFTIRPDGSLGDLRAGEGAHPLLVQAALETVRCAAPFPVMEGRGEDYSLRVTIRFQLE